MGQEGSANYGPDQDLGSPYIEIIELLLRNTLTTNVDYGKGYIVKKKITQANMHETLVHNLQQRINVTCGLAVEQTTCTSVYRILIVA